MRAIRCLQRLECVALVSAVTIARIAAGQDAPGLARPPKPITSDTSRTVPLIMSVSGAISVGAYQAGVNWSILEFLRRAQNDTAFRLAQHLPSYALRAVTGASAGNVNALLWAIEWCTDSADSRRNGRWAALPPDSSLFWKTWVSIGLDELLPNGHDDPRQLDQAIFDRSRVRRATYPPLLARLKNRHFRAGCSVPIGITLTRIQPDVIAYQGLEIETQRFATLFRASVVDSALVEPDGDRMHFVHLEHPADGDDAFGKVVRLLPKDARIGTDQILSAVQASAAFPIALAPVALRVWYPSPFGSGRTAESVFIDGGVFDNNPITLAMALYHHENASGAPPRAVYINPFRYRGDLDRQRQTTAMSAPTGGIAAFTEFLGGAVSTGRQYELQLLVRERRADSIAAANFRMKSDSIVSYLQQSPGLDRRRLDGLRQRIEGLTASNSRRDSLSFTSRSYPIYGEHLNAFAAFLGRPLREFDFYVGVYDGLQFAVQEFVCGGRSPDAIQSCTRQKMAELVQDDRMIPTYAQRLLATLYDRENYPDRGPDNQRALTASLQGSTDMSEQKSDRILLALYRAASTQLRTRQAAECNDSGVGQFLCRDGIGLMFKSFLADTEPNPGYNSTGSVQSILEEWSSACTSAAPDDCRAERRFVQLVKNPSAITSQLLEQIVGRMEEVEQTLKDEGQPDYARVITTVNAIYHTTSLRPRGQIEMSPSLPSDAAWGWGHLLPYAVGGPVGRSGWEITQRPTLNYQILFVDAFTFPLTWQQDKDHRINKLSSNAFGVGLGAARRSPVSGAGFLLNEIGMEAHWLIPAWHADSAWAFTEAYATFVGGYLRSSVRLDTHRWWAKPRFISITIALSDLSGLAYWVWRSR